MPLGSRRSYLQFMFTDQATRWFRLAIIVLAVFAASTFDYEGLYVSTLVRTLTGGIILFLLPGFVTLRYISDKEDQHIIERVILSIGLSIVITILHSLIFNFTVWGLHHLPIVATISLYVMLMSTLAIHKEYSSTTLRLGRKDIEISSNGF